MKYGTYSLTKDKISRKPRKLSFVAKAKLLWHRTVITVLVATIIGSSYFCTFVAGQLTATQAHAETTQIAPEVQTVYVQVPAPTPAPKPATVYTAAEIAELRNILYSEVGNRSQDKRKLEARVVVSTVLNRLAINQKEKRGPQTIIGVLHQPNQYQGWQSKQYNLAASGKGNVKKLEAIDAVLDTLNAGTFKDTANGAYFYVHNSDGTIEYDDTRNFY